MGKTARAREQAGLPDHLLWKGKRYQTVPMLSEGRDDCRRGNITKNMRPEHGARLLAIVPGGDVGDDLMFGCASIPGESFYHKRGMGRSMRNKTVMLLQCFYRIHDIDNKT